MGTDLNILAVANQKGGVGKTTTTVTIAGLLAEQGHSTLMIDLDPHGSLTSYFDFDPETIEKSVYTLFQHAAAGQILAANTIAQPTRFENLSILPASTALAALEKQLGGKPGMGLVLHRSLKQINKPYDYVVIDCPPMLGMLMINALAACGQLVIPVQTEFLAIKGLQRMLRTLKMIEHSLKTGIRYHVLPTLYDKRTSASKECLLKLQDEYAEHITNSVIPVDTKFRNASQAGKPLSMMHSTTHGVNAYQSFLAELGIDFSYIDNASDNDGMDLIEKQAV